MTICRYFYGHDGSGPQWLDDTWSYNTRTSTWTPLTPPSGERPHGRMSHAAVVTHNGSLLVFGGDDGGHRIEGQRGYKSSYLSDLWMLDVHNDRAAQAASWVRLHATNPPPPRAHHAAAALYARSVMLVHGGIHLDDIWTFDTATGRWAAVRQTSWLGPEGPLPGKRHGHAVVSDANDTGVYIFGGFRFGDDKVYEQDVSGPLSDLWHFSLVTNVWTRLSESHPVGGRTYASLVRHGAWLYLFAGANCKGSCVCFGDLWRYPIRKTTTEGGGDGEGGWVHVAVQQEPTTRYKQTGIVDGEFLYTFGGESYKPYMYHNSVSRIQLTPTIGESESLTVTWAKLSVAILGFAAVGFGVLNHFRVSEHRHVLKKR
eukprot:m.123981 g.123981  ORF g.123981 m.123981 type:complete len:371 (-) comp11139_c3_seq1:2695-3807(-)